MSVANLQSCLDTGILIAGSDFLNRKFDFELTCIREVEENKRKRIDNHYIFDFSKLRQVTVKFIGICGTSPKESGVYVRSEHMTLGFVFSERQ